MAKYIPDSKSNRWVILAPSRLNKPHETETEYKLIQKNGIKIAENCPFCPGNEKKTPCEIEHMRGPNGWQIRVFGNKFPITDVHEVIVHHPDHTKEIEKMTEEELKLLFIVYQRRIIKLSQEGVPILFRNKGADAGTSLPHPHSQIILLPKQINLEALSLEPIKNVVMENSMFVSYCPDFSQYPYEVWIAHKNCMNQEVSAPILAAVDLARFSEEELVHVSKMLQTTLIALEKLLGEFSYNYYISPTPPFYLRIIPRVLIRGGFELGTGLSTNTVDPTKAALEIRAHAKKV